MYLYTFFVVVVPRLCEMNECLCTPEHVPQKYSLAPLPFFVDIFKLLIQTLNFPMARNILYRNRMNGSQSDKNDLLVFRAASRCSCICLTTNLPKSIINKFCATIFPTLFFNCTMNLWIFLKFCILFFWIISSDCVKCQALHSGRPWRKKKTISLLFCGTFGISHSKDAKMRINK